MVQEAGIIPLPHCAFADVVMEGTTVKGVITERKSGRQAILAKRVIDATGDANLGTREARKIVGRYNLTEHDVLNEACFEDSIGICPECLDGSGYVIMPSTGQ
jgi:hypothetical protein